MPRIALLALALLLCAAVPAAAAPSLRATGHTKRVSAGGKVRIDLALAELRRCAVRTAGATGTVDVRGAAAARIAFRTNTRARTGAYPVRVRCDGAREVAVRVRVTGKRSGGERRLLAAPAVVTLTPAAPATGTRTVPMTTTAPATVTPQSAATRADPVAPPPRPVPADAVQAAEAAAFAQSRWDLYGTVFERDFRHGECTDLAQRRRPDIVKNAALVIWHDEYLGGTFDARGWIAHRWDDNARYAGLAVGPTPRPGAIAVFEPGVAQTGPVTGHVAYVEQVEDDGSFWTLEMNVGGPYLTAVMHRVPEPGISFVY